MQCIYIYHKHYRKKIACIFFKDNNWKEYLVDTFSLRFDSACIWNIKDDYMQHLVRPQIYLNIYFAQTRSNANIVCKTVLLFWGLCLTHLSRCNILTIITSVNWRSNELDSPTKLEIYLQQIVACPFSNLPILFSTELPKNRNKQNK